MSSDSQRNCQGARKAVQEATSPAWCWRRSLCGIATCCLPERDVQWKRSLWHTSSVCNFQDFLGPQWPCRWETLWWVEGIAGTISAPWPLWDPATKYSTSGWYSTCRTHNSSDIRHQPKGALDLAFCWGADYRSVNITSTIHQMQLRWNSKLISANYTTRPWPLWSLLDFHAILRKKPVSFIYLFI